MVALPGKWNKSLSWQPCDQEGDPLPDMELKEIWRVTPTLQIWRVAPALQRDKYRNFAHKINRFDAAPRSCWLAVPGEVSSRLAEIIDGYTMDDFKSLAKIFVLSVNIYIFI